MNTVQSSETSRNQGFWRRLLIPSGAPEGVRAAPGSARATVAIAAVPSAASLVWTAWSLIDMIPAPLPVGLVAGVVLDVALVSAVAIAWIAPQVAKPAKITGWLIALVAALLVGYHAYTILPVLAGLGLVPLVAKGLWHLALNARLAQAAAEAAQAEADRVAAAEKAQREAELSTDPTHDQKRIVAEKLQQAKHEEDLADAEVRLADAQAERDHKLKLAKIRRDAKEQREAEREEAATVKQRMELIREIRAAQPIQFALPAGEVPDDLSGLPAPRPPQGEATDHLSMLGFGAPPRTSRPAVSPLELEAKAREVYSPGMSLNAFRQALGVGMKKAHPLHQKLRAESEATG
ncbi:hypothetical protein ABZ249_29850 [Nocardiopsis sp. NPDC006139]|uniref:hypothetical protein n=1 Tax=Nocardiopsis sp. NPDC006139 TaxID=3154578 RepID=UPI0033B16E5A